jgi:dihydrofolate reductase
MNDIPKIVFARTGFDAGSTTRALEDVPGRKVRHRRRRRLRWRATGPIRESHGPLAEEIARLEAEPGKDILAHGGAGFAQSLVQLDLIDEYRLNVHPVVLGRGLPLFAKAEKALSRELVRFPKGTVAHVYRRR